MRGFPLIRKWHDPLAAGFDTEKWFDDFLRPAFKFGLGVIEAVPTVDIYEKDKKIVAKAEIPGVNPEDIKLSVDGNLLTISGEKKQGQETKKEERFSDLRIQQALEIGAEVLAICCPYCMLNFDDSLLTMDKEDVLEIRDISELVNEVM